MQSLQAFYEENNAPTEFTRLFLSGENMQAIREMLTRAVRSGTADKTVTVRFTESLLGGLLEWATKYRLVGRDALPYVNSQFVLKWQNAMVYDCNMGTVYNRWCVEGIPDPNNIPLPIATGKRNMTLDTSAYMLSHPFGDIPHAY